MLPQSLRLLGEQLADVIAPSRCMGCLVAGTWLCDYCRDTIVPLSLSCIQCGKANKRGLTCSLCRAATPLTGVLSVGHYHNPLWQRGIKWLKFKGIRPVAAVLGELLIPRLLIIAPLPQLQREAALVPLPLHPRRERNRGFNQSELLAARISELTGIPLVNALARTRATWTQSHLAHARELRQQNVAQAFAASTPLPSECTTVVVIDDVTTSGSTLAAAAQVLKSAGTRTVWGCTVARG